MNQQVELKLAEQIVVGRVRRVASRQNSLQIWRDTGRAESEPRRAVSYIIELKAKARRDCPLPQELQAVSACVWPKATATVVALCKKDKS